MKSRKEIRLKRKQSKTRKFLAGTLFLIIILGSSIQVTFADEDISAILSNWFNNKTEESINEIDEAISVEQQKQTERLKEELQLEIESAEDQLHEFIQAEKSKRVQELESYADELFHNYEPGNEKQQNDIAAELDRILEEAKVEMNAVE